MKAKQKISNKGRITNPAQAWGPAHREAIERGRIQDIDQAHEDALCGQIGTSVVPFAHTGYVERDNAPQEIEAPLAEPGSGAIALPLKFLQAALLTAGQKDIRYYLNGVYVHAVDGEFRICATDGHRLVVSRFELAKGVAMPEWAEAGIILPRDELAQALPILAKNASFFRGDCSEAAALIEYKTGSPTVTLRAMNGFAVFSMKPVDGKFPEYAKVLAGSATTLARGENEAMQASAINTRYLKGAADIAMKLGAKAVHAFVNGSAQTATFFTFDGAPDTCLIIMPMRTVEAVSDGVVKMIGRSGIEASLAAFKAHVTRTVKALTSARCEKERTELEDRKSAFEAKIAHLINVTTSGPKQIENRVAA